MDLLPFTDARAGTVAGWPVSAAEVARWCGRTEFPLPAEVPAGWQREEGVRGHLLMDGEVPVGYGEVWLDAEEDEAELARIIVAPGARGRGVGRVLVRGLLARAVDAGFQDVFLRVHPDNEAALRCYRGAGFVTVDAALAEEWNAAQPVAYVWLRHAAAGA